MDILELGYKDSLDSRNLAHFYGRITVIGEITSCLTNAACHLYPFNYNSTCSNTRTLLRKAQKRLSNISNALAEVTRSRQKLEIFLGWCFAVAIQAV